MRGRGAADQPQEGSGAGRGQAEGHLGTIEEGGVGAEARGPASRGLAFPWRVACGRWLRGVERATHFFSRYSPSSNYVPDTVPGPPWSTCSRRGQVLSR